MYSWGVLHHTGDHVDGDQARRRGGGARRAAGDCHLQRSGLESRGCLAIKWLHNSLPRLLQLPYAYALGLGFLGLNIATHTLLLKPGVALRPLAEQKQMRGMSLLPDTIDWIGGSPYEVASFERRQAL